MEKVLMTKSSLRKLEDDLNRMKGPEMRIKLNNLAEARDKGDISENSEYEIAKEEFENHQMRISRMNDVLNNVVLIHEGSIDITKVGILTTVKILNKKTNKDQIFSIVPENEINISQGKISSNTPIAKGLLGKSVGDIVIIDVPAGKLEFEILDINLYK